MENTIVRGKSGRFGIIIMMLSAIGLLPVVLPVAGAEKDNNAAPNNNGSQLSALESATAWINTSPIASGSLKGKVVLVEFCTYTCINWLRTLPYIRSWAAKYKDEGLVVIAVHTPEFSFENNIDNVRQAMRNLKIDFPVAVDNDRNIWDAFNNQYWPAIYLLDAKGRIAHRQFGEGGYDVTENKLQQLLRAAGATTAAQPILPVAGEGIEAAADWDQLHSEENYLGNERTVNFSSRGGAGIGKPYVFDLPKKLALNQWALSGEWTRGKNAVTVNKAGGKIVYRFQARDLHLVMGPVAAGSTVRFRVLLDGRPPGGDHGSDTDELGYGMVSEQRLYQLIRQNNKIVERTFEIEFSGPGAEAFSFTFG